MSDEPREVQALDLFLDELVQDVDTPAPLGGELDAETIACARRILAAEQSCQANPAQEASAQARVWQYIMAQAPQRRPLLSRRAPRPVSSGRARLHFGLAAAVCLVAAALGLYMWIGRPTSVSAQEILDKARTAASAPAAGGVRSFVLTETWRLVPADERSSAYSGVKPGEHIQSVTQRWYQAPDRWRSEYRQSVVAANGQEVDVTRSIQVVDGKDHWQYDPDHNTVVVEALDPRLNGTGPVSPFGQNAQDLNDLFQQASTCFDPAVIGNAEIAGRATYVVDLGPTKCPSASGPEMNGRLVLWIDQETFFVLKQEQYSTTGDKVLATREVTAVQYNISIDPAQFTFTPPAGAAVTDNRPKPAPSTDQFKVQLEQLAKQVDFPVFVPGYLPQGLAPRQPRINPSSNGAVEISYFPTSEPDKDSLASMAKGLVIQEQRATNSLVANWTGGADPYPMGDNKGWLRRGVRNADGTGSDSAALVLRDGVLVSVSSFAIAPEELVKIATSLYAVSGSHAPLTNPTPPSLAELRRSATYPIFVPAYVPADLVPEPPTGGEQPGENITIKYHEPNGSVALTVVNGTLDGSPGLDRMPSKPVQLANGLAAKLASMQANAGGTYLWFQLEGRLIALNSSSLPIEEILKIAASMSKTAELASVEPPPARPTPTPLPARTYTVVRPTWLSETMTITEQRNGDVTILGFDPRPNDAPHDVLTLTETPRALLVPGGSPDPQTTHAQVAGYDVTIVKRGENCITLAWDAGDLNLRLTNPYDPPGQPRFTCDQLSRIVESIR